MKISFTVCSANYLPYAKSLADSIIKSNQSHTFIIILLDRIHNIDRSSFEPHTIILAEEMRLEDFELLNSRFNIFELSCAMKPYSADFILKKYPLCEQIYYFDSDILVYNSLIAAESALEKKSVLLTPHLNTHKEFEGRLKIEKNFLKSGVFNAGFFALKKGTEAQVFLNWWMLRVKTFGYDYVRDGLFVDQIWLNFVPAFFKFAQVFDNDGYNVAYWNMGERFLSGKNEKYYINGVPLVFLHFSGFDIFKPELLSRFLDTYNFENRPEFLPLFKEYATLIKIEDQNNFFSLTPQLGKRKPNKLEKIMLKWERKKRRRRGEQLYPGEG